MMLQFNELALDLERIRRFLNGDPEERRSFDQRRFAYIACISALYSSFENFVERALFRFTEMLLADPANLSEDQMARLRRRYVRNASALLGQSLGVGRYRDLTEIDVAKSLASCLGDSASSLDLRLELVSLHNSNLRWESLPELFHWGISDVHSKIQHSDAVQKWASLTEDVGKNALAGSLASELNDLVERRNEVAHRAIPDTILSYERLLAKVDYIEAISLGLVASLAIPLLELAIKNGESVPLGISSEHLQGGRVVVLPLLGHPLSEGDIVLARKGSSMRWGPILEIKISGKRVTTASAGTEVGLRLGFAVKRGANLHLWRVSNSELAFPPDGIFGNRGPLG